jgi:hypothetical protein
VALPDMASIFGVRAAGQDLSAERSTIGSALFVAYHLKRLQGERYNGFAITRMLAPAAARCASFDTASHESDCEGQGSDPLHSLGWAFDVPSTGLSKTDQRDLKFILTDLRQAGLLAYVEDGQEPTFHVVRHPDHAARFEQFYWDAMAGNVPAEQPRVAAVVSAVAPDLDRSFDEGTLIDQRMPGMLMAISGFFSRVYSFFGWS